MMKRIYAIFLAIFLFGNLSGKAQNTDGTDFWLTFGKNWRAYMEEEGSLELQIRIVSMDMPVAGDIYFTELGTSVHFELQPRKVFTHLLTPEQLEAVYNTEQTSSNGNNKSIHITSLNPITAYALNQFVKSADATNLLPITALGTDYYQISYLPRVREDSEDFDAYAVIATEPDTKVYHNDETTPVATLNVGQVYYRTSLDDMTGDHITADKPVAFFSLNQGVFLPHDLPLEETSADCFMQQLAPVNTWGKHFFVPVSDLTDYDHPDTKNRVRILASQDNTTVTLSAGTTLITNSGGQTNLSNPLQAGQFFELEITLNNHGCYIQADKPVGVCAYLPSLHYNNGKFSDAGIAWLPSIQQTVTEALIAPFVPTGITALTDHYALIIAPTSSKDNTMVSIGELPATALIGGAWNDNTAAGWSFYSMPLFAADASYYFTNPQGIIIMGYGTGEAESYYYLAYSAMRNLTAAFYANDIYYLELPSKLFCDSKVDFRADVNHEPKSLKWYVDGVEEVSAQNLLQWSKNFTPGEYAIKMWGQFDEGDVITLSSTLNIGAIISTVASPPEGGTVTGNGCYKVGDMINLTATYAHGYRFVNWTENGAVVSTNTNYSFTVAQSSTLVANFRKASFEVIALVDDEEYGFTTGSGLYEEFTTASVEVTTTCYRFKYWTKDGEPVSSANPYKFIVKENVTLVANFYTVDFDTYCPTLWNNTFMLNLKKLREDGYHITGCKWFKNGIEMIDTNTINEFSYSAGPGAFDLLEPEPTSYSFRLITDNRGELCSTHKSFKYNPPHTPPSANLIIYPNPTLATFTVRNVIEGEMVKVYDQYGVCVSSAIATGDVITLTLNVSPGIYFIRCGEKYGKVMVAK